MNTTSRKKSRKHSGLLWILFLEVCILGLFLLFLWIQNHTENTELLLTHSYITEMSSPAQIELVPSEEQLLEEYIEEMTLEEKVGQLFFVTVGNLEEPIDAVSNEYRSLSEQAADTLKNYQPGGVILMGGNIDSDEQVKELTLELQMATDIPLYIGVDEEGGMVSRLGNTAGITMENVGPMAEVGSAGDSAAAYEIGETLATGLLEYGCNMDFAPVADVLTNPSNTEIGNRSFGSDANLVAAMVSAEVSGLQDAGVSAVTKHFPGHGGVIGNSHQNMQFVDTTMEELEATELLPFRSAIDSDTDAILISHLVLTELEDTIPSSLSSKVVTDLLRKSMGYEGVIITDSFQMGSITENYEQGEAAVLAIEAGCDMILMPMEYDTCYQAVIEAVECGQIPEAQIDESCHRILRAKIKRGILTLD
jgi:beta-N-acetylhexosaminidase